MMEFMITLLLISLFGVFIICPFLMLICQLLESLSSLLERD